MELSSTLRVGDSNLGSSISAGLDGLNGTQFVEIELVGRASVDSGNVAADVDEHTAAQSAEIESVGGW